MTKRHDKDCIADAMIAVVQNLRDSQDPNWTIWSMGKHIDLIAQDYLNDGTKTCICKGR